MIAGELESAFNDSYHAYRQAGDFFSFGKKNKQTTPGTSARPKPTLGQRLQKVGEKIQQAGGIEGIGRTADNVRSLFRKSNPNTAPSDYEIGLKKTEEASAEQEPKDTDKKKKKKNLVMIGVLVTGGIIVLGGLVWWMTNQNKQDVPSLSGT